MNTTLLWEEKNLIEQTMKSESSGITVPNDITRKIEFDSVKKECVGIGRKRNRQEKIDYTGKKFHLLTIIKQFIGNDNRTYVDCLCDCGRKSTKLLTEVKCRIQSCRHCQNRGKGGHEFQRKKYGESSFNQLLNTYKNNARMKNREFTLSSSEAKKLFSGNCFYCGKSPSSTIKIRRGFGEFRYNGIDRKDNTQGYTPKNSVTCCSNCNYIKNDIPFNVFIGWVRQVYKSTENISL